MSKLFHLAIDGNEANIKNRVGSNAYAFNMIWAFHALTESTQHLKITVLLSNQPQTDFPPATERFQYSIFGPSKLWVYFALSKHLYENINCYDAFYTPGHYLPLVASIPLISSIMDLGFIRYMHDFRLIDWLQLSVGTAWAMKKAKRVIAISQFTKKEIQDIYKLSPKKIVVAPPAAPVKVNISKLKQQQLLESAGLIAPYFLYLGTLQPRKNLLTLIKAYELFAQNFSPTPKIRFLPMLILAGKIGWLADKILRTIDNSPFKQSIKHIGYVSEELKAALYANALANLSLSPYEGFGIPPLEGLQYACLPIVADAASLPEVVGQAGIIVPPHSLIRIANAMDQVTRMSQNQQINYRQLAKTQLKQFSYHTSALTILQAILEL